MLCKYSSVYLLIVTYTVRDIDSAEPSVPSRQRDNSNADSLSSILRDSPDWLSYFRALHETDIIILLTPVVVPIIQDPTEISDPFEPFGRALARRHSRVRHVPYTFRLEILKDAMFPPAC